MANEMPAMASSQYAHSHFVPDANQGLAFQGVGTGGVNAVAQQQVLRGQLEQVRQPQLKRPKETPVMTSRRIVQVFVADTDENVPLDKCVIYSGEQKLTDLTDQELFFEIDIKSLLNAHNAERVKLVDKRVKERTEHLEPARIRDLKMTVVTVATF